MSELNIRLPKTLGCAVASTALIQSLKEKFSSTTLNIYTEHPSLIYNLEEADIIRKPKTGFSYNVDLKDYVSEYKPSTSKPF